LPGSARASAGHGVLHWLQAKLEIGAVDDPLEKEADRVADQVVGAPAGAMVGTPAGAGAAGGTIMRAPAISVLRSPDKTAGARAASACPECEEEHKVQTKAENGRLPHVAPAGLLAPLGGGRALDGSARRMLEGRFAHDFSGVRVHDGPSADAAARSIDARAFTLGHDIVFRTGAYSPTSSDGQRLLAHELTHVVQQGAAAPAAASGAMASTSAAVGHGD